MLRRHTARTAVIYSDYSAFNCNMTLTLKHI